MATVRLCYVYFTTTKEGKIHCSCSSYSEKRALSLDSCTALQAAHRAGAHGAAIVGLGLCGRTRGVGIVTLWGAEGSVTHPGPHPADMQAQSSASSQSHHCRGTHSGKVWLPRRWGRTMQAALREAGCRQPYARLHGLSCACRRTSHAACHTMCTNSTQLLPVTMTCFPMERKHRHKHG